MSYEKTIESKSVEETLRIGRAVGEVLCAEDVVGLTGCLGAGKTHLTKGIALGLGVMDERAVNSPTFVLVNEYAGRMVVHHVDAYRLASARQLEAIGFEEMCQGQAVVIVEWADRVTELMPEGTLWMELRPTGETRREIVVRTASDALAQRIDRGILGCG